ncbi:amino acid adenylation domain-containing protein [Dactylosporangium sp. NBC_01737]|uniref:non-ribosomal peptide synthetase n=1 Tax=Dactylosporangium sp. NBC_01737 TaxID=2975959 RepID=UPI002E0E61FA|nr:amino acid adenylation domain-containing protein [Dactylosporangium sp. NBC_01737]
MDQPTELQTRAGAAPQDLAALRSRLAGLSPDKRRLVERMLARKGTDLGIIRRAGDAPEAPCSFEQERLWFMYELLTRREIFHVPVALRIDGDLDAGALERALQRLALRHEALRTVFRQRDGKPYQLVLDRMTIPLDRVDCRAEADPVGTARHLASELVTEDFDLTEGPLVRCTLYHVGERTHLLALVQHHIVSDNWSLGILLDDLGRLYANELGVPVELAPLDVHYPDFAGWQRSTVDGATTQRILEHWRERLDGAPDALDLPTDRPRPAIRGSQGRFHHVRFGADLVAGLRDLASKHDTTLLGAFLAGYVALLSRLVRADSLVVGVPVAGRPQAETQRMIGYFLNWLPIHVRVGDRPDLHTLVRRTGSALADAMGHQDIPFDMLVRELQPSRQPGVTPIFQTSFSLRDGAPTPPRMPGLEIGFFELEGGATHYDLMAELWCEGDEVVGYLPFDDELLDAATVARWAGWLETLLRAGLADPDVPVADLAMLGEDEPAVIPARGLAGAGGFEATLHAAFAARAARHADAVAVSDDREQLTYAELSARAGRIAAALQQRGEGPGSIVGLVLDRGVDLPAAILGVLQAGAAYLPIDPENPADRTADQFAECRVHTVLATPATAKAPALGADGGPQTLVLDWQDPAWSGAAPAAAAVDVSPDAPAYVIYTSGSTGKPKGVLVAHRHVLRLLAACDEHMRFGPDDVWTLFHSYAFDFSVWELWGALLHGGRLLIVPQWATRAPDVFAELVLSERVTVLSQTPSAFGQVSAALLERSEPQALRYVVFGGEALNLAALRPWVRAHGDRQPELINMYGITETTVHVTVRPVREDDLSETASLIGPPLPDLSLYLLDASLHPVGTGVPGEIFVGGDGVSHGYVANPALTAQRMLPDPFAGRRGARMYRSGDLAVRRADGELVYLGRGDDQVKVRGHRIELGEVQAALSALDDVARAAVVLERDRVGAATLAGYAVPAGDAQPTGTGIRRALLRTLPEWMVPASVTVLDELPLTRNGKLDRKALAGRRDKAAASGPRGEAPHGDTAVALAAIWTDLLGVPEVGGEDNFFELGGHSLMVMHMVARIRTALGVEVPMETLFSNPQLQPLADAVDEVGEPAGAAPADEIDAVRAEVAERVAGIPRPGPREDADRDTVLLTGATGFVGRFVLAELLASGARVVCLVRGGTGRRDDLVAGMSDLGLWREEHADRLELVDGDIAAPRLGLSTVDHDRLATGAGRIVHAAAWVNHVYPYEQLAAANTHSMAGLLELAAAGRRCALTVVSTSSVFDPTGDTVSPGPLRALPAAANGYVRSKAVAELYLDLAEELDVPAVVVRIPSVFGDQRRFQINAADAVWSWSRAMIDTGSFPESFALEGNELFQALPADAAARTILLADRGHTRPGTRYVDAVPAVIGGTQDLVEAIRAAGHRLRPHPDREWYSRVGELDPGRVWVAGIAGHVAAQLAADPSAAAPRTLRRFAVPDEGDLGDLLRTRALHTPAQLTGYIRTLDGD